MRQREEISLPQTGVERGYGGLIAEDHGAVDVFQLMGAAHGHGVSQLGLQLFYVDLHAFGTAAVDHVHEGAGDEHRVSAQGQGLEHVHAGADAAVHENGHLAAHGVHDGGEDFCGGGALVQHAAAVVGHHDAAGTGLQGLLCAVYSHDALEDKRIACQSGDRLQLFYGLAAGLLVRASRKEPAYGTYSVAALAGALVYAALYLLKSYYKAIWIQGVAANAAWIVVVDKLPATIFNGAVAVIFAPILAVAIRKALKKNHLTLN